MLKIFRFGLMSLSIYLFMLFSQYAININENGMNDINTRVLLFIVTCQIFIMEGRNLVNYFILRKNPEDVTKEGEIKRLIRKIKRDPHDKASKKRVLALGYRPLVRFVTEDHTSPRYYEGKDRVIKIHDPDIILESLKLSMNGLLQKEGKDFKILGDRIVLDEMVADNDDLELQYATYEYI